MLLIMKHSCPVINSVNTVIDKSITYITFPLNDCNISNFITIHFLSVNIAVKRKGTSVHWDLIKSGPATVCLSSYLVERCSIYFVNQQNNDKSWKGLRNQVQYIVQQTNICNCSTNMCTYFPSIWGSLPQAKSTELTKIYPYCHT